MHRNLSNDSHVLIVSPFLLSELCRVMRYARLRKMHGIDESGINAYVQRIEAMSLLLDVPIVISAVVPHDPDDDPVIGTAIVGRAEVICTRDRHFKNPHVQAYCAEHSIRIMNDIELLELLRASEKQE